MSSWLLERFGVSEADLIGEGAQSVVYALSADRVLRLWRKASVRGVDQLRGFLSRLDRTAVSFEIPEVFDIVEAEGRVATVERRLPGRSLQTVLPLLGGVDRDRALESYAEAAASVARLDSGFRFFGDLLCEDPVRAASWREYLVAKLHSVWPQARLGLARRLRDVDGVLATIESRALSMGEGVEARLVHGDFFPPNVLVDEAGSVVALVDFSGLTVAGDARLDLASAVVQVDVLGGASLADRMFVANAVLRQAPGCEDLLDLYARWYAVLFCQWGDGALVDWAAGVLQAPPLVDQLRMAGR